MATKADVQLNLSIKFGNATTSTTLKCKEPSESIVQLGLKNNPAADFHDDIDARFALSKTVTTRLRRTSISSKNAFQLYRNIWLPKMQYPLGVTSFSKQSCLQIMKPFVCAILPKLRFNRNTTRAIIHDSHRYGGFQMAHLYNEQGYLAIKHLIGHIREETITGKQLMIALSYAQLVAGC
eukprot:1323894-Ditylum_brightwellii.AAC.1